MTPKPEPRLGACLGTVVIAAAAGIAFAPALHGRWLWDDAAEIPLNPVLRDREGLWRIWSGQAGQDYFPLTGSAH